MVLCRRVVLLMQRFLALLPVHSISRGEPK
jgi:hypothetical protein